MGFEHNGDLSLTHQRRLMRPYACRQDLVTVLRLICPKHAAATKPSSKARALLAVAAADRSSKADTAVEPLDIRYGLGGVADMGGRDRVRPLTVASTSP